MPVTRAIMPAMKAKIVLISFGAILGLLVTGLAYPYLRPPADLPAGSQFETLEEFQRVMVESDERDLKSDRSVSLRSIIAPHPSLQIMYELRPNLSVKFQGVPLQTNDCGMRGPQHSLARDQNTLRIALLGDSFAFGWGVKHEESFAAQLESVLNGYLKGEQEVEVLNFSVPGYSTFQEVALFEEKGLDFDPDLVLVYFVNNDFGLPFFIKNIYGSGGVISGQKYAKKSRAKHDLAIRKQQKRLERMLDPNRALRRLSELTGEQGIKLFVAINPHPRWRRDKRKLWILRENPEIHFLNLRPGFEQVVEEQQISPAALSLKRDPHPSALKHKILGELLAGMLYSHMLG
ncbi:SGNH/GDSL hydrolase family protein [Oligoflexia bacterium]|nr:SGNH/GDSL hydrolase family protein [Oligoflexia bacterium]